MLMELALNTSPPPHPSPAHVRLTDRAAKQILHVLHQEKLKKGYLRLSVLGGGCSGFQYQFSLETAVNPDDILVEKAGTGLLVDNISLPFLENCEIDFVEDLSGAGFQIRNPNAQSSCGCGNSFAPKM